MSGAIQSFLPSGAALGLLFVLAGILALYRRPRQDPPAWRRSLRLLFLGIGLQSLHFLEELVGGFHQRFPGLWELPPMSEAFFVAFNLAWIAIWTGCGVLLQRRRDRWLLVPIWFFAIAMTLNGVVHPLLALRSAGYFPGLLTSPLVGIVGALLLAGLWRATAAPSTPSEIP